MTEWVTFDNLMVVSIIHAGDLEVLAILVINVDANEERLTLNVDNIRSLENSISSMIYFNKFLTEVEECTDVLDKHIMCMNNDRYENSYVICY